MDKKYNFISKKDVAQMVKHVVKLIQGTRIDTLHLH